MSDNVNLVPDDLVPDKCLTTTTDYPKPSRRTRTCCAPPCADVARRVSLRAASAAKKAKEEKKAEEAKMKEEAAKPKPGE